MPYLTVGTENSGKIELYYEDHGSGRPVVLIHGWPLSSKSWEKQTTVLLEAGLRVISYDRRGFGESSKPAEGYHYDTLAADLHELLTRLELQNVALVGFSMGGGEVARYIRQFGTDRVSQAVFIAAIPPALLKSEGNPEGVDAEVFEGIKVSLRADRPAFLKQFLQNFYNVDKLGGERVSDEVVQLSWNIASGASPKGTLDCVSAWLEDFRPDLQRFTIPTLVIHGDEDRIVPLAASGQRTQQMVPGARIVVLPGAPHGCNWTHAEEVNRALLDFLRQ